MNESRKCTNRYKNAATFDNFNFSKCIIFITQSNQNAPLSLCQLVYGEMNRVLIYFRPLHVFQRTHNSHSVHRFIWKAFYWLLFIFSSVLLSSIAFDSFFIKE